MQLYKQFCNEEFNSDNTLKSFKLKFEDNYNFGYDVLDKMAEKAPNDIALVWTNPEGEERIFTFADLSRLSNKAANVFLKYGIKKGDRVLLMLKRNYEYWYIVTALHKLGVVAIPATNMLTAEDISYRVNVANIKMAVCTPDSETIEHLLTAANRENSLKTVFVAREDFDGTVNITKEIEAASDELERVETKADEPMLIYFTSGTTGYPKAVVHNHIYSLCHIISAKYWQNVKEGGLHFSIAETGWAKASWGKIYGQWLCGSAVMVYDFDKFSPGKLLRIMEKYKVTTFCAPPTVYRYFIKRGMNKYDLSALSHLTTAGEALNNEVFEEVFKQTGIELCEGFGQTESVLMLANLKGDKAIAGSMGKPTPLYDVRIVDDECNEVKQGEVGEVVVFPPKDRKQHGIFITYYNNENLYEKVWRHGVYHTGDTAYKDENGYFWYVGRADDLIKTRGFRVGPFEVENVLMQYPNVLECAVIGVPDKDRGQAIKAIVKMTDGAPHDKELENKIKTFCNKRMASYKWIQHLEIVDEFPKTISGKIKRTDLRENHKA